MSSLQLVSILRFTINDFRWIQESNISFINAPLYFQQQGQLKQSFIKRSKTLRILDCCFSINFFEVNCFFRRIVLNNLSFLLSMTSACYNPDGTATKVEHQPCNPDGQAASMCCALNRPQSIKNECLSNGLCWDVVDGSFWRDSCTDSTWNSPFCLKDVCTDPQVS